MKLLPAFCSVMCLGVLTDVTLSTRGEAASNKDVKRIILHSDDDLMTEVLTLRQQVADLNTLVHNLSSQVQTMGTQAQHNAATQQVVRSTYTRWGRTTCPGNGTTIIYSGYMGGTHHGEVKGTGADFVCLSDSPTWDHNTEAMENKICITGIEYSFNPHQNSDSIIQFLGENVFGGQAPCAVCQVTRSVNIMVPGRTQCLPGWTLEYRGYLVTGYPGYADSSQFICLDRRPESVVGSGKYDSQNELFFVEAQCGDGLECPPYVNGRELACVVCSQ